jgi:hypothetical protein
MPKQKPEQAASRHEPGPGRSTSEAAFNVIRKEVAESNERAHQAARKLRVARERDQAIWRRARDAR